MIELFVENNQNKIEITDEITETAKRACEETLSYEDCDFDAQISLTFVDNEEIRRLNKEFRQKDAATDVLSFPMLEFDKNGDIIDADYDVDDGEIVLGDIVISAERALSQAEEYGHSFLREVTFLVVHSMLHLLGYDHVASEEEETRMRQKQTDILNQMGITRE